MMKQVIDRPLVFLVADLTTVLLGAIICGVVAWSLLGVRGDWFGLVLAAFLCPLGIVAGGLAVRYWPLRSRRRS